MSFCDSSVPLPTVRAGEEGHACMHLCSNFLGIKRQRLGASRVSTLEQSEGQKLRPYHSCLPLLYLAQSLHTGQRGKAWHPFIEGGYILNFPTYLRTGSLFSANTNASDPHKLKDSRPCNGPVGGTHRLLRRSISPQHPLKAHRDHYCVEVRLEPRNWEGKILWINREDGGLGMCSSQSCPSEVI